MPRSDGRLEPGQRLNGAISARAWNRMMDASDIVHGERYSIEGSPAAGLSTGCAYVWAELSNSYPIRQFSAVKLMPRSGLQNDSGDIAQNVFPSAVAGWVEGGSLGITLGCGQPIVRIAVAGLVQCWLNVIDEAHGWCSPETSQDPVVIDGQSYFRTRMETAWYGDAEIVWKEQGTGTKIGLVRLNSKRSTLLTKTTRYWEINSARHVTLYSAPSNPLINPYNEDAASTFDAPVSLVSSSTVACNFLEDIPPNRWVTLEHRDGSTFVTNWGPRIPFIKSTAAMPWPVNNMRAVVFDEHTYSVSNPWGNIGGTGTRDILWRITGEYTGELLAANCSG